MNNAKFEPHGIHRIAGHFFKQSAEDYGAARCCLIHGLFPGFVLAEQAVEKLIKGFLRTGNPSIKWSGKGHQLADLQNQLVAMYPQISLSEHTNTIKLLQSCYDVRYPDSASEGMGRATSELRNIDSLYMYLADQVPIGGELKYQIGVFPHLYAAHLRLSNMPDGQWMLFRNEAALRALNGRPLPENIVRWRDAVFKRKSEEQRG